MSSEDGALTSMISRAGQQLQMSGTRALGPSFTVDGVQYASLVALLFALSHEVSPGRPNVIARIAFWTRLSVRCLAYASCDKCCNRAIPRCQAIARGAGRVFDESTHDPVRLSSRHSASNLLLARRRPMNVCEPLLRKPSLQRIEHAPTSADTPRPVAKHAHGTR